MAQVAIPAGPATAIGLAAWHRADAVIGTGVLFAILLLARECFRPLTDLLEAYHASYYALPASKEVFALLARSPDVTSPAAPVPVAGIAGRRGEEGET